MTYKEFVFEQYRYDPAANSLSLHYHFLDGPRFEERLVFDFPPQPLSPAAEIVLDGIFRLILLLSGVSYYKAFAPETLRCTAFPLDPDTAAFVQYFYENGLAEFAWKNRISLAGRCQVLADRVAPPEPVAIDLARRSCVPIGGGKDSIVTLECLKTARDNLMLFALGDAAPIMQCIAAANLPFLRVLRRLDPALARLNTEGALNGHVPITGILSAVAAASAVLAGCDTVVMSNEHSASAPNFVADGVAVNHQFSKSLDFEEAFAGYLARCITPSLAYFSLLRPLAEIEIARRFARCPQFFGVFRSCNTAFRQRKAERGKDWCGNCPKCRFVFLALAPFIPPPQLTAIFERNLLDDEAQLDGFAELCGLRAHKPFECVGEIAESAAVMSHLTQRPEWCESAVVKRLRLGSPALRENDARRFKELLERRHPHRVPERFLAMLDACG